MSAIKAKQSSFCDAIRAKEKWFFKILDGDRSLALKWANEAGFLNDPDSTSEEDVAIRDAIEELKGEARRIQIYDYTIRLDRAEVPRPVDFHRIDSDVLNALKYVQGAQFAIDNPDLRQHVGAFVSDDVVPISLHRELVAELDALSAVEPKDFHPETYGKVQDLIHPSLYPFIAGITYTNKPASIVKDSATAGTTNESFLRPLSTNTPSSVNGEFVTSMEANSDVLEFKSIYSWIPSVFEISEDGLDVRIQSYINGLGPREQYPVLYRLIEKVFLLVLPQLERTLGHEFNLVSSNSVRRWFARQEARDSTSRAQWEALLAKQALKKEKEEADMLREQQVKEAAIQAEKKKMAQFYSMEDSKAAVSRPGAKLKVIVKAANYVLKPGQEYGGTWHIEGMPHERIVASAIYYYETDPEIEDEGLSFRYLRNMDMDFPSSMDEHSDNFHVNFSDGGKGWSNDAVNTDVGVGVEGEDGDEDKEEEDKEDDDDDGDGDGDGDDNGDNTKDDKGQDNEQEKEAQDDNEDEDEDDEDEANMDYPSDWEEGVDEEGNAIPMALDDLNKYIPMGAVPATNFTSQSNGASKNGAKTDGGVNSQDTNHLGTGRIITFPNWVQHRVTSVKNGASPMDPNAPIAKRKILCFFLVDDDNLESDQVFYHGFTYQGLKNLSVLTTADVPFQKRCNIPTLHILLPKVCLKLTGKNLPAELVAYIANSMYLGLSKEMAEHHRRQLMHDRKVQANDPDETHTGFGMNSYSLCEH